MSAHCKLQPGHNFSFTHGLLTFFGLERSNISRIREHCGHTTVASALKSDWGNVGKDIRTVFESEVEIFDKKQLDACESK